MIDSRNPHVERRQAQFESDPGNREHHAEYENRLWCLHLIDGLRYTVNFQRSGRAVEH